MSPTRRPDPSTSDAPVDDDPILAIDRALGAVARSIASSRAHEKVIMRAGLDARIDRAGFTALARIHDHGPLRLSDLAALLGVDLSTVSRQVRTIEDQGLVVRRADPTDGRAAMVEASADGRQALQRLRESARARLGEILVDWSDDERHELARSLARFDEAMRRYGDRP